MILTTLTRLPMLKGILECNSNFSVLIGKASKCRPLNDRPWTIAEGYRKHFELAPKLSLSGERVVDKTEVFL